ncbi:MAG: polysaccharide biosynthesis C-terminal domain-containing protein [Oscillospiraceae bacterium]|nr:polysaccharide biosynthesis C-terminal domain-containing protein [Oscillospiraceae bacterium]
MGSGISRSTGDSATPLAVLVITAVRNVALNYIFVKYCGLGVAGVACAMVIAEAVSAVVCFLIIWRR